MHRIECRPSIDDMSNFQRREIGESQVMRWRECHNITSPLDCLGVEEGGETTFIC